MQNRPNKKKFKSQAYRTLILLNELYFSSRIEVDLVLHRLKALSARQAEPMGLNVSEKSPLSITQLSIKYELLRDLLKPFPQSYMVTRP